MLRSWWLVPVVLVAAPVAFVSFFVWPFDVVAERPRTICEHNLANGGVVRLVQYWNNIDFYTLELLHIGAGGGVKSVILDGDASRIWWARIAATKDTNILTLNGLGVSGSYDLRQRQFTKKNGVVLSIGQPTRDYGADGW